MTLPAAACPVQMAVREERPHRYWLKPSRAIVAPGGGGGQCLYVTRCHRCLMLLPLLMFGILPNRIGQQAPETAATALGRPPG
jgi:hypothetical protein